MRQAGEHFEWRSDPVEGVALARLAFLVGDFLGKQARAVEIDIRVEVRGAPGVDLGGETLGDMRVAQVLADDRTVLRLGEAIVVGMTRARLGEFGRALVEHTGHLVIDVLRSVVGMKAQDAKREARQ